MFERFETREDIELTTKTKRIKKANLYMQYAAENFTSKELRAVYYSAIGEKVPDAAKDESGKFQNSDNARLLFNVKGRKLLYKVIKSFQTLIQAKKLTDVISISSSSPSKKGSSEDSGADPFDIESFSNGEYISSDGLTDEDSGEGTSKRKKSNTSVALLSTAGSKRGRSGVESSDGGAKKKRAAEKPKQRYFVRIKLVGKVQQDAKKGTYSLITEQINILIDERLPPLFFLSIHSRNSLQSSSIPPPFSNTIWARIISRRSLIK